MLEALSHIEDIAFKVFTDGKPRIAGSADSKSMALSDGVIHESIMFTHDFSVQRFHITRLCWKVVPEEVLEIPFTDKADARAVFLCCRGKSCFLRDFANLLLVDVSKGEHDFLKLILPELIEEVGLILIVVYPTEHLVFSVAVFHLCVMPCGKIVRPKLQCMIKECLELDFLIAHHIRVRCTSRFVFIKEIGENLIPVLLLEVDRIIRNADLIADADDVIIIFRCSADAILIGVIPVFHEHADDFIALLFQ